MDLLINRHNHLTIRYYQISRMCTFKYLTTFYVNYTWIKLKFFKMLKRKTRPNECVTVTQTLLCTRYILTALTHSNHLILTLILGCRNYFYPHFINEKTKGQRALKSLLHSQTANMVKQKVCTQAASAHNHYTSLLYSR